MKPKKIEKLEISFLQKSDYPELMATMQSISSMHNAVWEEHHIAKLIDVFPEGQAILRVNGKIAGCALSIIVPEEMISENHTYSDLTGNYTFKTHTMGGDILYGVDVFIRTNFRGLRLGRRLYAYRKQLCKKLNLKAIAFGGRIPNYHKYAADISPQEYLEKVQNKEITDPVLNFQLSNEFHPERILEGYLEGDKESCEYAILLKWTNIYYKKPDVKPKMTKKIVRLGLIQWQMRNYKNLDDLMQHAEYFVSAVSGYACDFALFPEYFNAPLMADLNDLNEHQAIWELALYTPKIKERFAQLAVSSNINIIAGSMPEIIDGVLYNAGYLCKRDGTVERYVKIHVTPGEARELAMQGGNEIRTFDTDCGKIGVLICYDVEFPELSRLLADEGMDILFVPFLTDTQNGYARVRNCAQARAIENECYVAIAGSVGNLPKINNMDIQFAQSVVFTPCDFAFPTNGIKAEATPNTEMILVVDVDIDLLRDLHTFGSVKNLRDRRKDVYTLKKTI